MMNRFIISIFLISTLLTFLGILYIAPTTGGPCNAGLDKLVTLFLLILSFLPASASVGLIVKNKMVFKNEAIGLSMFALVIWGWSIYEITSDSPGLLLFMIPNLLVYLLITFVGLKMKSTEGK